MSELERKKKATIQLDPMLTDPGNSERWLALEMQLIECSILPVEERRFLQMLRYAQRMQQEPEGILSRELQDRALVSHYLP